MNRKIVLLGFIVSVFFIFLSKTSWAEDKSSLHPRNRGLIKLGQMEYPKYCPEIPRMTALEALHYYKSGKAFILFIAAQKKHLIVGGIHLTEQQYPKIDPNKLPIKKGQALFLY